MERWEAEQKGIGGYQNLSDENRFLLWNVSQRFFHLFFFSCGKPGVRYWHIWKGTFCLVFSLKRENTFFRQVVSNQESRTELQVQSQRNFLLPLCSTKGITRWIPAENWALYSSSSLWYGRGTDVHISFWPSALRWSIWSTCDQEYFLLFLFFSCVCISFQYGGHHDPPRLHKPLPDSSVQFQVFFISVHRCPSSENNRRRD